VTQPTTPPTPSPAVAPGRAREDAVIATAAFPVLFSVTLRAPNRCEALNAIADMAQQARGLGWTVRDGRAYLLPEKRAPFAKAVGLSLEELTEGFHPKDGDTP
jgi:hypothetical protein